MAWIESHQELARHPKVVRLARTLKITKAQAIGHLHLLWWWTLDFSPTGELSAFTSCELGSAAEWTSDADHFRKALEDSGWIDPDGRIHDWHDYAGKLVEQRARDSQRKRELRRMSAGQRPDGGKTAGAQYPTVPNPTTEKVQGGFVEQVHRAQGGAPASPTPPPERWSEASNKPKLEHAFAYFEKLAADKGERFEREEIRSAFNEFEASRDPDSRDWMWGKRRVGHWPSAMIERMAGNRERRAGRKPATSAMDSMVRAINKVKP